MQLCFYSGGKSAEYKTAFKILGYSADDLRIRFIIDKDCLAPYFVNWVLTKINADFPIDAFAADNVIYAIDYLKDEDTAESVKGRSYPFFTAEISNSIFAQIPVALTEKEENTLIETQFVNPEYSEEVKDEITQIFEMAYSENLDNMIKTTAYQFCSVYQYFAEKRNIELSNLPGFRRYVRRNMNRNVSGWLNEIYIVFAQGLKDAEAEVCNESYDW